MVAPVFYCFWRRDAAPPFGSMCIAYVNVRQSEKKHKICVVCLQIEYRIAVYDPSHTSRIEISSLALSFLIRPLNKIVVYFRLQKKKATEKEAVSNTNARRALTVWPFISRIHLHEQCELCIVLFVSVLLCVFVCSVCCWLVHRF